MQARVSDHLVTYLCEQLTDDLARGADRTTLMPLMPNKIGANIEYAIWTLSTGSNKISADIEYLEKWTWAAYSQLDSLISVS